MGPDPRAALIIVFINDSEDKLDGVLAKSVDNVKQSVPVCTPGDKNSS